MKRILLLLIVAFILSACEDSSDADAGNPSASLNPNTWIGDLPIIA